MAFRRLTPPLSRAAKTFREAEHGVKFNSSVPNSIPLPDEVDTKENEIVAPEFTNRNPHNLERLAIARKDLGWKTSWPKRDYWYRSRKGDCMTLGHCNCHKYESVAKHPNFDHVTMGMLHWSLRFEKTQKHVEGYIEHCSGHIVVSASTREWAIKKHLYKTTGVAACENVGRVLAQRCLEAGINFVDDKATIPWEKHGEGLKRFKQAMTEGGVELTELERIYNKYGDKLPKEVQPQNPAIPSLENNKSHNALNT